MTFNHVIDLKLICFSLGATLPMLKNEQAREIQYPKYVTTLHYTLLGNKLMNKAE